MSAFDLNSGEVLEHWPVAFAVREIIANALDEQILTGSADPEIAPRPDGRGWSIRDFGRGIHYRHLTQSESTEKLGHPEVIGKFGFGLNDALAVLDRNGIGVTVRSRHGVITTSPRAKAGFPDVVTLHGVVADPDEPEMTGTEVVLTGVSDDDVLAAKSFFLRFNGERVLEETRYGQVVEGAGAVYVKGLRVAEEPKFLFSYSMTAPDAKLNLADDERAVLDLAPAVAALVDFDLDEIDLRISNTMRPSSVGAQEVGLWSPSDQSITIKRSQLASAQAFCGTLLHEIGHAASGETDRTLAFEEALTDLLGHIAAGAVGSVHAAGG